MSHTNTSVKNFEETPYFAMSGFLVFPILLVAFFFSCYEIYQSFSSEVGRFSHDWSFHPSGWFFVTLAFVSLYCMLGGLMILKPNQNANILFFGTYRGTIKREGFFFYNPLADSEKVDVRVDNYETSQLKVNDKNGNPIEIAAVIVWRVFNVAQASLALIDYKTFVRQQSEAALREIASKYPYEHMQESDTGDDKANDNVVTLRANRDEIAEEIVTALREHLEKYGIEIMDASISHLSYAPEIAAVMLQRQQASAIVAARKEIVAGATGMVDQVIEHYTGEDAKVQLGEDEKRRMVTNLMTVLSSGQEATPTVPLT